MKSTCKVNHSTSESSPFTYILYALLLVANLFSTHVYAGGIAESNLAFAFASRDPAALAVVSRYFKKGDYLSVLVAREMPDLGKRIGNERQFKLSASLSGVADWANRPCNDPDGAAIIIYDNEEWEATPEAERLDIPKSVGQGAGLVKASGCRTYGLAPARSFISKQRGCNATPSDLNYQINWKEIDVLVIQAQSMLLENCVKKHGVKNYRKFVIEIAKIAKIDNPEIKIFGEVSFNRSTPEVISQAIDGTMQFVDGIYLAYPQDGSCSHCSPEALEQVLSSYRSLVKQ